MDILLFTLFLCPEVLLDGKIDTVIAFDLNLAIVWPQDTAITTQINCEAEL